jgi:hypothetical protein
MRRFLLSRFLLTCFPLILGLLLAAAPLAAYTIYLKDGGTLIAREKYKVEGTTAVITLMNGSKTSLPLADVDVAKTEESNQSDFGSAQVIGPRPTQAPAQARKGPTLSEVIAQRRGAPTPPPRPTPTPPPRVAAPVPEAPKAGFAKTPAGNVDFLRSSRTPPARLELASEVGDLMRAHGVEGVGIYSGTQPRRLLVEVTANSEGAVFQAIGAAAQALLALEAKQPGAVEAFELFLATDRRQRGGQFLITRERAEELVGKKLDLTAFYLKYVEF